MGVVLKVKNIIRTDTDDEKEIIDIFNEKLWKVIMSIESSRDIVLAK